MNKLVTFCNGIPSLNIMKPQSTYWKESLSAKTDSQPHFGRPPIANTGFEVQGKDAIRKSEDDDDNEFNVFCKICKKTKG